MQYVISTPCKSRERKQLAVYQTQSNFQFHSFLVYQAENFLQVSTYVSNVITITLLLNKYCKVFLSFLQKIIFNVNTKLFLSFVQKIILNVNTVTLFLSFVLKMILDIKTVTLLVSFSLNKCRLHVISKLRSKVCL